MEKEQLEKIKKLLYKHNPVAHLSWIDKNGILYYSLIEDETFAIMVIFVVPLNDLGDAKFNPKMDAKHLIRYIDTFNKIYKGD